jgi:hypothetical protein
MTTNHVYNERSGQSPANFRESYVEDVASSYPMAVDSATRKPLQVCQKPTAHAAVVSAALHKGLAPGLPVPGSNCARGFHSTLPRTSHILDLRHLAISFAAGLFSASVSMQCVEVVDGLRVVVNTLPITIVCPSTCSMLVVPPLQILCRGARRAHEGRLGCAPSE